MEASCMVSDSSLCDFGFDVENAYNHPPFALLIISPVFFYPLFSTSFKIRISLCGHKNVPRLVQHF